MLIHICWSISWESNRLISFIWGFSSSPWGDQRYVSSSILVHVIFSQKYKPTRASCCSYEGIPAEAQRQSELEMLAASMEVRTSSISAMKNMGVKTPRIDQYCCYATNGASCRKVEFVKTLTESHWGCEKRSDELASNGACSCIWGNFLVLVLRIFVALRIASLVRLPQEQACTRTQFCISTVFGDRVPWL